MARHTKLGSSKVAIGYLRVSTEEQHLGPEAQRASIEAWAAREGVSVVAWHVDHGVSGAAPLERRAALLDAVTDLRAHGAGVLVVAKRDRLARDPVVAAMAERLALDAGARIISAAGEGSTGDDPTSVLMRRIVDAFAEHERLLIAMRTRQALAAKKAKGERVGEVPFGMRSVEGRLVPCDDEQRVLGVVRELRARRMSQRAIVAELLARGMVSRAGKPFGQTQVHRMLRAA